MGCICEPESSMSVYAISTNSFWTGSFIYSKQYHVNFHYKFMFSHKRGHLKAIKILDA